MTYTGQRTVCIVFKPTNKNSFVPGVFLSSNIKFVCKLKYLRHITNICLTDDDIYCEVTDLFLPFHSFIK